MYRLLLERPPVPFSLSVRASSSKQPHCQVSFFLLQTRKEVCKHSPRQELRVCRINRYWIWRETVLRSREALRHSTCLPCLASHLLAELSQPKLPRDPYVCTGFSSNSYRPHSSGPEERPNSSKLCGTAARRHFIA